jgi:sugar lactone lactonase YvrE
LPGRSPLRLVCLLAALATLLLAAPAGAATLDGVVRSGPLPLPGLSVSLHRAGGASGAPQLLGRAVSDVRGRFAIPHRAQRSGAVLYLTAGSGPIRLAAVLGPAPRPRSVVVNELTTAAAGFALAQFVSGGARIAGPAPGPRNAALMARNLADVRTGSVSPVLLRSPNGGATSTLATFRSVANMLAPCARDAQRCARLYALARTPGGPPARGTLQAVADVADHPWQNVRGLFALSLAGPRPYGGALPRGRKPAAWTLPVRFVGDGRSIDGPGNFAIDGDGNVYVANNYEYGKNPAVPRCGSRLLPKFKPDGRYAPGSPFRGGGLDGAGYGITLDPDGNVWVGNYGFAAPAPKCPERRQPPHDSVSKLSPAGRALSGPRGIVAGGISWPQGTVSDRRGTIWIANCGNGTITRMPSDDPSSAVGIDVGLEEAFDVAVDGDGLVYATAVGNSTLAVLNPDGSLRRPLLDRTTLGLNRPMGIAADSRGNMWIANSGLVNLPCPKATIDFRGLGGSLSLVAQGGRPLTRAGTAFTGGGLTVPWGIAVDGDDNVWVSNFFGSRISQFCGIARRDCRPGASVGDPISPPRTGYAFDGLVRSTAVQVDPAGNVWATNNWKRVPVQTNPGGYEVVVFVGAAAPIRTPLIGPPVPLMR